MMLTGVFWRLATLLASRYCAPVSNPEYVLKYLEAAVYSSQCAVNGHKLVSILDSLGHEMLHPQISAHGEASYSSDKLLEELVQIKNVFGSLLGKYCRACDVSIAVQLKDLLVYISQIADGLLKYNEDYFAKIPKSGGELALIDRYVKLVVTYYRGVHMACRCLYIYKHNYPRILGVCAPAAKHANPGSTSASKMGGPAAASTGELSSRPEYKEPMTAEEAPGDVPYTDANTKAIKLVFEAVDNLVDFKATLEYLLQNQKHVWEEEELIRASGLFDSTYVENCRVIRNAIMNILLHDVCMHLSGKSGFGSLLEKSDVQGDESAARLLVGLSQLMSDLQFLKWNAVSNDMLASRLIDDGASLFIPMNNALNSVLRSFSTISAGDSIHAAARMLHSKLKERGKIALHIVFVMRGVLSDRDADWVSGYFTILSLARQQLEELCTLREELEDQKNALQGGKRGPAHPACDSGE